MHSYGQVNTLKSPRCCHSWVMSHWRMSRVTHMNETWVMSHVCMSHDTHVDGSSQKSTPFGLMAIPTILRVCECVCVYVCVWVCVCVCRCVCVRARKLSKFNAMAIWHNQFQMKGVMQDKRAPYCIKRALYPIHIPYQKSSILTKRAIYWHCNILAHERSHGRHQS